MNAPLQQVEADIGQRWRALAAKEGHRRRFPSSPVVHIPTKAKCTEDERETIISMVEAGHSQKDVAKVIGCSRAKVTMIVAELERRGELSRPTRDRRPPSDEDRAIYRRHQSGEAKAAIGRQLGIGEWRVRRAIERVEAHNDRR